MLTNKSSLIVATAAFLLSSSALSASDLNGKGSTKDGGVFDAPASVNWSGFFIGGRLGYGHANHDLTVETYRKGQDEIVCEAPSGDVVAKEVEICVPQTGIKGEILNSMGINGLDSSGATGGGQIGFDLQRGRFVFGVFGSYDVSGMETTVSINDLEVSAIEKGDEWSAGVRAGLLVNPRTMAYVLAAYTESDFKFATMTENGPGSNEVAFSGLTVGGGVEFALTQNVFLGVEGTHTFYGKETLDDSCDECVGGDIENRLTDEIGETKVMGTLKVKLNTIVPGLN